MADRTMDDWRMWIAENMQIGLPAQAIAQALVGMHGMTPEDAVREVNAALASPYVQGGGRARNRLRKRDWTLSVYAKLNRMRGGSEFQVERREKLSRDEFFENYYFQNRPVVITGMFEDWPARSKWNFDYFRERCGDSLVEVQFGRESDPDFEINGPKHKRMMTFRDYVDLVETSGVTNDFYMTANNTSHNRQALDVLWSDITPIEEYLDGESKDNGFFWLGPAGTKTPFHHDLTNNFMAQVIGRKRLKMIPMHDTAYVYNHLHCFSRVDGSDIDFAAFPQMQRAQLFDCTIGPGDLLFIPIGWWHYVEGLDASVTMSFINFLVDNDFASTYDTYQEL